MEFTQMSSCTETPSLSPGERRREIAAILAHGVLRLHRNTRIGTETHAKESQDLSGDGLEVPGQTRLSVSDGTHGLCVRNNGDNT